MAEKEEVKIVPVPRNKVTEHQKRYSKPKKTRIIERTIMTPKGDEKVKYIRVNEFEDGVKKQEIIGMTKNGIIMWGVKE